jgi:hypothetical protein
MTQDTYNLASFIATCVGFTVTIISVWFLYRQIVVARRTRESDALIRLYEISTRQPLAVDFDIIWDLPDQTQLSESQSASCLRACLFFEMVGAVVSERYMDTALLEQYFGSLVTGSYDSLRSYVEQQRSKPYNRHFALNFERLAEHMRHSVHVSPAPGQSSPAKLQIKGRPL